MWEQSRGTAAYIQCGLCGVCRAAVVGGDAIQFTVFFCRTMTVTAYDHIILQRGRAQSGAKYRRNGSSLYTLCIMPLYNTATTSPNLSHFQPV